MTTRVAWNSAFGFATPLHRLAYQDNLMLSKLFGKKKEGIIGYIYVADGDEGILSNSSEGKVVKNKGAL